MTVEAEPFKCFINPDDTVFAGPGNMPERIREYCQNTGQSVPKTPGEIIRCINESLAFKYRDTIEHIEDLTGKTYSCIHIIGGGTKNKILCEFTAYATGKKVIAGPVEATAIGNLMTQAMALGQVNDIDEIRKIVKTSFNTQEYNPVSIENNHYKVKVQLTPNVDMEIDQQKKIFDRIEWEKAYQRYKQIYS